MNLSCRWCAVFPHVEEAREHIDFIDDANKTLGYTVLEGNPGYHYFKFAFKFVPGATAGTTDVTWTGTYIPMAHMGPPEHVKQISIKVIRALANAAKDNQLAQNGLLRPWFGPSFSPQPPFEPLSPVIRKVMKFWE